MVLDIRSHGLPFGVETMNWMLKVGLGSGDSVRAHGVRRNFSERGAPWRTQLPGSGSWEKTSARLFLAGEYCRREMPNIAVSILDRLDKWQHSKSTS